MSRSIRASAARAANSGAGGIGESPAATDWRLGSKFSRVFCRRPSRTCSVSFMKVKTNAAQLAKNTAPSASQNNLPKVTRSHDSYARLSVAAAVILPKFQKRAGAAIKPKQRALAEYPNLLQQTRCRARCSSKELVLESATCSGTAEHDSSLRSHHNHNHTPFLST